MKSSGKQAQMKGNGGYASYKGGGAAGSMAIGQNAKKQSMVDGAVAIGQNSNLVKTISSGQKFSSNQSGIQINQDGQKRTGFEISRNQIGSRGRSHGPSATNQQRRNIQQIQMDANSRKQNQAFENQFVTSPQAPTQPLILKGGMQPGAKHSRNGRSTNSVPTRGSTINHQNAGTFSQVPPQANNGKAFVFDLQNGLPQAPNPATNSKGAIKQGKLSQAFQMAQSQNQALLAASQNAQPVGVNSSQTIKRIRESRQRGNKSINTTQGGASMAAQVTDQQNQIMQAYINQSVGLKPVANGQLDMQNYQGPGPVRATEPGRMRAHTDMKKAGLSMGMKAQAINSREHLNQTTVMAGNSHNNNHLSQGMQQFHSRGNSMAPQNLSLGIPNQPHKRSQSVDKSAPQQFQINQQSFLANQQHAFQQQQTNSQNINGNNMPPHLNPNMQQSQSAKDGKSQHFIHEAIERKIERFSRQRNRGGLVLGSSANAAQSIYNQQMSAQFSQPNPNQNQNEQVSRNFKTQQKHVSVSTQQNVTGQVSDESRKKKVQSQPQSQMSAGQPHGQILIRGEIMSAGQNTVPQRKLMTANQVISQQQDPSKGANLEQTGLNQNGGHPRQFVNNMIEGYQQNPSKKHLRSGSRGIPGQISSNQAPQPGQPGSFLAQKIVQLPKQQRSTSVTHGQIEGHDQRQIRLGKFKLDKLHKQAQEQLMIEAGNRNAAMFDIQNQLSEESPTSPKLSANDVKVIQNKYAANGQRQSVNMTASQNPQLQGSQGAQIINHNSKSKKGQISPTHGKKEKIALISLTNIDLSGAQKQQSNSNKKDGTEERKHDREEPDEHAVLTPSHKRGKDAAMSSPKSISSHNVDHHDESIQSAAAAEYGAIRSSKSGKKAKNKSGKNHNLHIQYEHGSRKAGSNGSVTVSMRDDSIMHMSVNSVTDNNFIIHKGDDAQSCDSNDHFSIKKQMIRYLSRVADRNKPLFVFNQKLNLGDDSSDDDTGTPSFSLVALIEK